MRRRSLAAIALLPACAAGAALACGPRAGEPTGGGAPLGLGEAIDAVASRAVGRGDVPGVAVATVDGGAPAWSGGWGSADREAGVAVSPGATVFQVASLSKPVSAWVALRLADTGRLELDEPVERSLTRWHFPPSPFSSGGVTARRLLSHTAGVSLPGYPGFPPEAELPTLEESLSGATNGAGDVRLVREPGAGFLYSGGGFTVIQLLVEERTGRRFEEVAETEVLAPLGLASSSFAWRSDLQGRIAAAYDASGRRLPDYRYTARAAAGLHATAGDYARWIAAAMVGPVGEPPGRGVVSPASVRAMHAPAEATGGVYGLGHEVLVLRDGRRAVGHSGANRGWTARFAALPDRGAGIVVLTNGDGGGRVAGELVCLWLDRVAGSSPVGCS